MSKTNTTGIPGYEQASYKFIEKDGKIIMHTVTVAVSRLNNSLCDYIYSTVKLSQS